MLNDIYMDIIIKDIIDIFNDSVVECVRIKGLTNRLNRLCNTNGISQEIIIQIIKKLEKNNIIKYNYILLCPYCGEMFFQIKEINLKKAKLCDTCHTMFSLLSGTTLYLKESEE